mgnify:FL=1
MKRIEFEGQVHEFPDDATEAEITQALGGGTQRPPFLSGLVEAYRNPKALVAELLGGSERAPLPGGYRSPEAEMAGKIASAPVPSSFLESGQLIGTALGGPAGRAVPGAARILGRAAPAVGRVIGGAIGGETGGRLEGAPPGRGALLGGGGAATGEVLGPVLSKVFRSLPGMKARIAGHDAAKFGMEMERLAPPLGGARTAEDIRALAAGPGREALGQAKEQAVQQIEARLGQLQPVLYPWQPGYAAPGHMIMPSLGNRAMTLREANDALSEIGARAFSKNPLDRTFQGVDQRRLYGRIEKEIEQGLRGLDPTGGALQLWQPAQQTYKAGLALMRETGRKGAFRTGADLQFNTPAFQRRLADPRVEADLRKRFGDVGFERLRDRMLRGGAPGEVDVLAPGSGRMSQAAGEILRGKGGAPQIPALLLRTPLPNLGSTYAGRPPYTLPPALQTILDLALQKAGAAGLPR